MKIENMTFALQKKGSWHVWKIAKCSIVIFTGKVFFLTLSSILSWFVQSWKKCTMLRSLGIPKKLNKNWEHPGKTTQYPFLVCSIMEEVDIVDSPSALQLWPFMWHFWNSATSKSGKPPIKWFFPLKKISNGFPSHKSDSIQVWKIPTWWKMKYLWNNTKTL